jgi:hypothetical protein
LEGRSATQNLRSTSSGDLPKALQHAADELVCEGSPIFNLVVEGTARDLNPILRNEVSRIACQCLRNAFNTLVRQTSKRNWPTEGGLSGCAFATTAVASHRRFWNTAVLAITASRECASAPNKSAGS